MLFSSMVFLWVFLPGVLFGNLIISLFPFKNRQRRIKAHNLFLLAASLFFYAWGGIYYLLIMISSILINYTGGLLLEKAKLQNRRKLVLIAAVVLNLAILFVFKYFNLVVAVVENIMAGDRFIFAAQGTGALGIAQIVLPIGISFFTFQAMSYVIDVYRGDAPVQRNLFSFALYVSFFPQLIAGPIVRYADVAKEINDRRAPFSLKSEGIRRFCYGLGKKVLLANTFAKTADAVFALNASSQKGMVAWLGIICYTLQIYFDFSGYSDMAIGLGRMFGFHFKENFNYPYISCSIREFWRRWHISLSSWFKEYVYIPLGGNRKGKIRTYVNLFIVFLLTGIWHGANFTFLSWGLYYGIILVIERLFLGKLLDRNPVKLLNHLYVLLIVVLGWVLFRASDMNQAVSYLGGLFTAGSGLQSVMPFLSMKLILSVMIGILLCGPLQELCRTWYQRNKKKEWVNIADMVVQLSLLVFSILSLIGGTYNPFIYFQF